MKYIFGKGQVAYSTNSNTVSIYKLKASQELGTDVLKANVIITSMIATIVLGIIGPVMFLDNLTDVLKIKLAPRVYLIDQIKNK